MFGKDCIIEREFYNIEERFYNDRRFYMTTKSEIKNLLKEIGYTEKDMDGFFCIPNFL